MSCSSCTRGFSLFTREHACPGCGFSVCSGCLKKTLSIKNKQQKVCSKCWEAKTQTRQVIEPPQALQKRMEQQPLPRTLTQSQQRPPARLTSEDQKIAARLKSLQEERSSSAPSSEQVRERLDRLKDLPTGTNSGGSTAAVYQAPDTRTSSQKSSDLFGAIQAEVDLEARMPVLTAEQDIEQRLARLRGENTPSITSRQQPSLPDPKQFLDTSEHPQTDLENVNIDDINKLMQEVEKKMKLEADNAMKDLEKDKAIQEQLERLRVKRKQTPSQVGNEESDESDEDPTDKILAKILAESRLEDRLSPLPLDGGEVGSSGEPEELPWCVICNDDAVVRCEDCHGDLYCRSCFSELHRDKYDRNHRTQRFRSANSDSRL